MSINFRPNTAITIDEWHALRPDDIIRDGAGNDWRVAYVDRSRTHTVYVARDNPHSRREIALTMSPLGELNVTDYSDGSGSLTLPGTKVMPRGTDKRSFKPASEPSAAIAA
jgi:hypothetical protein